MAHKVTEDEEKNFVDVVLLDVIVDGKVIATKLCSSEESVQSVAERTAKEYFVRSNGNTVPQFRKRAEGKVDSAFLDYYNDRKK